MKFKEGDKVRIVKPKGLQDMKNCIDSSSIITNRWIPEMDMYDGTVFTLNALTPKGWSFALYGYLEDWLELVVDVDDKFNDAMSIL